MSGRSEQFSFFRIAVKFCFLFVIVLLAATACKGKNAEPVAAVVNGKIITVAQVDSQIAGVREQYAAQGAEITNDMLTELRTNIIDSMIEMTLLLQEAEKLGIEGNEVEAAAQLESIKSQFETADVYNEALKSRGYTEGSLMQEILDSLTIDKLIENQILKGFEVDDAAAMTFYEENPEYFEIPESLNASHILISLPAEPTDANLEAAMVKVRKVQDALSGGMSFAEAARTMSEDSSASNGGSLGTFARGQMVPEFENAAFALEPGVISEPVRSMFGFHFILVSERIPPSMVPYDDVSPQIVEYLKGSMREEKIAAYIEELKTAATIEISEPPAAD